MVQKVFVYSSFLLLIAAAWGAWGDYQREWKPHQRRYNELLLSKITDEQLRRSVRLEPEEVRQIVVQPLGRVDRCVSCHLAYDNADFADQAEPLRFHPDILRSHPAEKFGCSVCHGGQGMATTFRGAAHEPLEYWEEPMLKGEYLQAACGRCHREGDVAGAHTLSIARMLYKEEFMCDVCHKLNGEGGLDGPDLSHVGSKPLHAFDFTYLKGEKTRLRWFEEHFKDPQAVVPESEMTNQEMTGEQARAMTILMLSLTNENLPAEYRPGTISSSLRAQESSGSSAPFPGPAEVRIFEAKRCILCHTLRGRGGKVGPDLSQTASRRNADWLFQHFKDPRSVVPGSRMPDFQLTDEEANDLTRFMLSLKSR